MMSRLQRVHGTVLHTVETGRVRTTNQRAIVHQTARPIVVMEYVLTTKPPKLAHWTVLPTAVMACARTGRTLSHALLTVPLFVEMGHALMRSRPLRVLWNARQSVETDLALMTNQHRYVL